MTSYTMPKKVLDMMVGNAKQIPIIPVSIPPAGLVEWTMFLPIPGGTMPVKVWINQSDYNDLQRLNSADSADTTPK